jgi:hypothetical protein
MSEYGSDRMEDDILLYRLNARQDVRICHIIYTHTIHVHNIIYIYTDFMYIYIYHYISSCKIIYCISMYQSNKVAE